MADAVSQAMIICRSKRRNPHVDCTWPRPVRSLIARFPLARAQWNGHGRRGPGSGAGRKLTLDRDGAIKLLRAATTAGVLRYLMISGAGVENPPDGDEVFAVYLRAKAEADAALEASDREWTILRPSGLTDDAGTGSVRIGSTPFNGPVPRDDVASVLAHLLTDST